MLCHTPSVGVPDARDKVKVVAVDGVLHVWAVTVTEVTSAVPVTGRLSIMKWSPWTSFTRPS